MKTIPNCVIMQQLPIPSRYNDEKKENVFGAKEVQKCPKKGTWDTSLRLADKLVDDATTLVVFFASFRIFCPSGVSEWTESSRFFAR